MSKEEKRGRPITCRYCGHKFRVNDKNKRKQWVIDQYPCPKCRTLFCYMTEIEKELQIIQLNYISNNRNKKYLEEMHGVLLTYAKSIIKGNYIDKINDKSLLPIYAESAVSLLIEDDFIKKKDFIIDISFGSRLKKKCIQAIESKKEAYERHSGDDSLDYMFQDGNYIEYADHEVSEIRKVEQDEDKFLLLKKICSMIFEVESHCGSPRENYIRLINVLNYLEGGEKAIDSFFDIYGREGKMKLMQTLNIIRNEIKQDNELNK